MGHLLCEVLHQAKQLHHVRTIRIVYVHTKILSCHLLVRGGAAWSERARDVLFGTLFTVTGELSARDVDNGLILFAAVRARHRNAQANRVLVFRQV